MPFTIPNTADAGVADQAAPDKVDFDMLWQGVKGDGVLLTTDCAVTAQGSPNMTVAVAAGNVTVGGTQVAVVAGNVTITTANGSNPRFDLIVVSNAGVKSAVAGTPAASPVFPSIPANSIVLAAVRVATSTTTITTANIIDKRFTGRPKGYAARVFANVAFR